ncbi:MAG: alanine racemase [Magnetovibrio sp.]|nr:alanine racemase [Magnetovibrio sp.]
MIDSAAARRSGAVLSIDLGALADNWRVFQNLGSAESGAVVKAGAYGLDIKHVAPALLKAGCQTFFVASIDEAIELREAIGGNPAKHGASPTIHVFYGLMDGTGPDFHAHDLCPVLNSLQEVAAWQSFCADLGQDLACDIHIDTGMARLGLDANDIGRLVDNPHILDKLNIDIALSHLVSAEDSGHPKNTEQLNAFTGVLEHMKPRRASLSNSSGAFLNSAYHFDVLRPGVALYGANPTPEAANPMAPVIRLQGRVLQVRSFDQPGSVGYGSTYQAVKGTRIATLAAGYADGLLRSLSNAGNVYFGSHKAPMVGCVSMDLITVDVTNVPQNLVQPGLMADIIGPLNPIDDVADKAGTIGYELLTQLGTRYHRVYLNADAQGNNEP